LQWPKKPRFVALILAEAIQKFEIMFKSEIMAVIVKFSELLFISAIAGAKGEI